MASSLDIAVALMEATVRAGASRQVAAATVATLFRLLATEREVEPHGQEVKARLDAIAPTLEAKLKGTLCNGGTRAKRNVAAHCFDLELPFSEVTPSDARRIQRGHRRGRQTTEAAASQTASEPDVEASHAAPPTSPRGIGPPPEPPQQQPASSSSAKLAQATQLDPAAAALFFKLRLEELERSKLPAPPPAGPAQPPPPGTAPG